MKYLLVLLILVSCSSYELTFDDLMHWHDGCMSGAIEAGASDPVGGWMICDKLCEENFSYTGYCEDLKIPYGLEE